VTGLRRPYVTLPICIALFWSIFLPRDGVPGIAGKKGKIQGQSHVNLRSGPGINHPPIAVLREGDEVTVEQEEGSWHRVSSVDGKRGYVDAAFVRTTPREGQAQGPEQGGQDSKVLTRAIEIGESRKKQPSPLIKLLEGKEWEIFGWVGGILCSFILGWVLGGNYYLRRDRKRRSKLRL
jgi:hypothetical protein